MYKISIMYSTKSIPYVHWTSKRIRYSTHLDKPPRESSNKNISLSVSEHNLQRVSKADMTDMIEEDIKIRSMNDIDKILNLIAKYGGYKSITRSGKIAELFSQEPYSLLDSCNHLLFAIIISFHMEYILI